MEPVNITICGTPSAQTLADLFAIAMRDGLGFVLPPRVAAPSVAVEAPTERRLIPERAPRAVRRSGDKDDQASIPPLRSKHVEPVSAPPPSPVVGLASLAPDVQAARGRRDAIVGQLRRTGDVGLSFRALLAACRAALAPAGDADQQANALRNALTILQREGRVKRFAGQWLAVTAQES
jgi:hypothetical protein